MVRKLMVVGVVGLLVGGFMTGCGDDDSSPMPTSPSTLDPPTETTTANRAPEASGPIPAQVLTVGDPTLVEVAPYFSDPDGDELTYAAMSSDPDTVTATVSGSIVTLTALGAGPATVTVTATDPGNLTATQMLRYRATWEALAPTTMWRGLAVADENRCSRYDPDDYSYPQSVEADIVAQLGGVYSPYTCETFDSTRETDIEHVVARSEAHDSGLCAADVATRERFAGDLLNLTLASPALNRNEKRDKDAAEWQPDQNTCWFAKTVVDVRLAYGLTVDPQERDALERMLAGCSSTAIACDLEPSNRAPEAVGTIPAQTLTAGGSAGSVDVAPYFRDPDDDALTYAVASSSTGTVTASASGSTVTLTPVVAGTATVTVTASDGSLNTTQNITVTVTASSDPPPPVQVFRNCTAMRNAGWIRGVNRKGGTYKQAWDDAEKRTYQLNTARDRDNDGHACE